MNPGGEKKLGKNKIPVLKKSTELLSQFSAPEIGGINKLKEIYLETVHIDSDLQQALYELEFKYQKKQAAVYDKRAAALLELRKKKVPSEGEGSTGERRLFQDFWLRVLKNSYTEFISKKDEAILLHLIDIRPTLSMQPQMQFTLDFHFEPNEFFTDRVLRKTYFMNYKPDAENPLSFDGAEIYRSQGCTINWTEKGKKAEAEREDFGYSSFFDFFSPPELPKSDDDRNYSQINTILQNDYELGFYLKERVVPKAILFYTGEANDCESDSEQEDSGSEEEDSEAYDDEVDSSNEAADEPAETKPQKA